MSRHPLVPYAVLAGGVLIVASASIMVRFAQQLGVPSITVAAGRLCLAALILLPIATWRVRGEIAALRRSDAWLALGAGLFLAVHFASWISSLAYTSVASSSALVATNPLWVGLASLLLFRERLGAARWVGIALTLLGSALIGISDTGGGGGGANPTLGNLLALLGAIAGSGYFLIGRGLRRRISVLLYIWLVYSAAAVALLLLALFVDHRGDVGQLLAVPPAALLLLLGLAVGPQLLGHTAFNWSLGHISATFIALALLGEPVGSALLAWAIFGETFQSLQLAGFSVLLVGIGVAAIAERQRPAAPAAAQRAELDTDLAG